MPTSFALSIKRQVPSRKLCFNARTKSSFFDSVENQLSTKLFKMFV